MADTPPLSILAALGIDPAAEEPPHALWEATVAAIEDSDTAPVAADNVPYMDDSGELDGTDDAGEVAVGAYETVGGDDNASGDDRADGADFADGQHSTQDAGDDASDSSGDDSALLGTDDESAIGFDVDGS